MSDSISKNYTVYKLKSLKIDAYMQILYLTDPKIKLHVKMYNVC